MRKQVALFSLIFVVCGPYNEYQQLRTFVRMQAIAKLIDEDIRGKARAIDETQLKKVVRSVGNGLDSWGHPFEVATRVEEGETKYVIVSRGSDGVLEFGNLAAYFTVTVHSVHGEPRRDLIIRDGSPITLAGK